MQRREALGVLGGAMLTPLLGSRAPEAPWQHAHALHQRAREQGPGGEGLPAAALALVTSLADTILPRTDTPGALDVGVPGFVDLLVAEWYSEAEQQEILAGLGTLDARCREAHGKPFAELGEAERLAFLATVDGKPGAANTPEGTYRRMKDAIVQGYLTAKPVAESLRTVPIMIDRFDGCIPVGGS